APFGKLAGEFSNIEAYGENGKTADPSEILYYAVYLNPSGIVLLPADDEMEPITAYAPDADRYGPEPANPLYDIIGASIAKAVKMHNSGARRASGGDDAREKWEALQDLARPDGKRGAAAYAPTERVVRITDMSYLTGNSALPKWNQEGPIPGATDGFTFNTFTPKNYLAGCGAVMIAQMMRSFKWPENRIDVLTGGREYDYWVDDETNPRKRRLLGGDGAGGPYVWAPTPTGETISRLMADCAIAIGSIFGYDETGSHEENIAKELTRSFGYRDAVLATSGVSSGFGQMNRDALMRAMNSNIDAGKPVGLCIFSTTDNGGHAVVVDAYGYSYGSIYHNVNMGYGATTDTWFGLPGIYDYDIVDYVIYNIYDDRGTPPLGSEIISGRVLMSALTATGAPAAGAVVTITGPGVRKSSDPLRGAGRFFFDGLQADTEYTLTAQLSGHQFPTVTVRTGRSFSPTKENGYTQGIGNRWDEVIQEAGTSDATTTSGGCGAASYPLLFALFGAGVILLRRKK
ncbi:MAG: C10 family peptidase, partial [Synergistaceae bacterium]|nr:C10 family peptidase [Synergistaceae bacterium]